MAAQISGSVVAGSITNSDISATANLERSKTAERPLLAHPIDLLDARVWDEVTRVLPNAGTITSPSTNEGDIIAVSFPYDPGVADSSFFVAQRAYRVLGIVGRVEVAGTDGGAVTAEIRKAASATDIASGTLLHTGTFNLKGTVDTNQTLTLSATSSALDIASGTCIGFGLTGTPTDARGVITVLLAPAASADDLMLVTGTFGSAMPRVKTGDVKAQGSVTKRARFRVAIPSGYVDGDDIQLRALAGMETTVSDGTATIDFECYKMASDGSIGSDLIETSATTINSLTFSSRDFTITSTGLVGGDILDVRVSIAVNDSASVGAVIGSIAGLSLRCDVKP